MAATLPAQVRLATGVGEGAWGSAEVDAARKRGVRMARKG